MTDADRLQAIRELLDAMEDGDDPHWSFRQIFPTAGSLHRGLRWAVAKIDDLEEANARGVLARIVDTGEALQRAEQAEARVAELEALLVEERIHADYFAESFFRLQDILQAERAENTRLRDENARLCKALEVYRDRRHWSDGEPCECDNPEYHLEYAWAPWDGMPGQPWAVAEAALRGESEERAERTRPWWVDTK